MTRSTGLDIVLGTVCVSRSRGVDRIKGHFKSCQTQHPAYFNLAETPMMYLSTDLLNWKNLGPQAPSVKGFWRPKIAKPNGQFWVGIICQLELTALSALC